MSPYEIGILLHYYACADDHPHMFEEVPAWRPTIDCFKLAGLIEERPQGTYGTALYRLTERGRVFVVEGLLKVPLPVQTWKMPDAAVGSAGK